MPYWWAAHLVKISRVPMACIPLEYGAGVRGTGSKNGTVSVLIHLRIRREDGADGPGASIAEDKNCAW